VARLAQRLKWAIPETNDLFDGEFINSERAKELGLIDKVISTEKPNGNLNRVSGCETGAYHAENA
jgi:enoyl-CoA hydratase/carnithine racemase